MINQSSIGANNVIVQNVHQACLKIIMNKAENYKPRFPIPSGAPCVLASLFTSRTALSRIIGSLPCDFVG